MKDKTSSGVDGISNSLLKRLIEVIKRPLCSIINHSLLDGEFPDLMKLVKIIPLHKGGELQLPDNYQPISLLPVLSKVLEHVIYDQTIKYLENNSVLYARQYGFRKFHSTSDAVMNLVGEVLTGFERDNMILGVFIDLRKAFDTVSHSLILEKLSKIGVNDVELKWFESYLSIHRQWLALNHYVSDTVPMTVGVPQGALLGVLLFQLIINDMYQSIRYSTSILYADDTTLLLSGRSLKYLKIKLQQDLHSLSNWLKINNLKLNVQKTKCILFNHEGPFPNIELMVGNEVIETVQHYKFLRIIVDHTVSFLNHYNSIYDKLIKVSFIVRSLSQYLPTDCLRHLYYAYYHSHLTYCMNI